MKVEMLSGELLPINSQYHRRPDGHVKTIAKELREFLKPDFSVGSNWVD
jgi:hypothetical protein